MAARAVFRQAEPLSAWAVRAQLLGMGGVTPRFPRQVVRGRSLPNIATCSGMWRSRATASAGAVAVGSRPS
jgi:hypothetical protein